MRLITFPRQRGWSNQFVMSALRMLPGNAEPRIATALGATLAAFCRKPGQLPESLPLKEALACPDCGAALPFEEQALKCPACSYRAPNEGGVFNLLSTALKAELYPGARPDTLDFSKPGHEEGLLEGFFDLEGDFGNKYRWIGGQAKARLKRVRTGPQMLRVQGYAPYVAKVELRANGAALGSWKLDRPGLFILEAPVAEAPEYIVDILASPTFAEPGDGARTLSVNLSLLRLQPPEA
ncbi:MAG: hypothetical protein HY821_17995 [Acidobacteria bacterium]|nr:hypothetical protein [Acidobacteriota bacterium]